MVMFVFWIQPAWKHLAIVDIGRSYIISADESWSASMQMLFL